MFRTVTFGFMMVVAVSLSAHALTGSGDSDTNSLETVSPTLVTVTAAAQPSLTATFSEPMLVPGVTTPGNYGVSGPGADFLPSNPTNVMGPSPYAFTWATGEMTDGATVTLTATGLQDLLGNLIDPAHNSASCAGIGVPPTFADLLVAPPQAAAGDMVTITFTTSEALNGDPIVTVNGHDAVFESGGASYTYAYPVEASDPLGMASLSITGFDLAANMGSLSNDTELEIIEHGSTLPLYAWPAVFVLLLAAVAVLVRKPRSAALLLLVAALLASSSALAANPAVSNVTFTQGPNGTVGTKVDIYYDLIAPNGPCAILLSLSKDGGTDGFIYPITHYAGDIANVTTGTGMHIVWDIRADYPEESIPQARIRVTADDVSVLHTLTYLAGTHGSISGTSPQTVNHGASGTQVTADPNPGYHFMQWSDASTQNPRTDTNVTADITVTATFAINQYTLSYSAGTNGSISGTTPQTVNHGASGTAVTANAAPGYHFVRWSDASMQNPRSDTNVTADITVTATFAINTYTIACSVVGNGTCTANPATVNHGATSTITVTPAVGWHIVSVNDSLEGPKAGSYTTTPVTANRSVTGTFAINTYTIACNVVGNGTCTANPATVNHGATSTITVTPAVGWHIVSVDDSVEGPKAGSYTTTPVTANRSVTATFAINTFTLTYTTGPNGSISGTSPQTVNYGASGTTVTAVPNGGYAFQQWSDLSTQNPRTDTNITADVTVTASFVVVSPSPVVNSFAVNSGAATTVNPIVTLNNTATNSPTDYMASESASFSGVSWVAYATGPSFTLSTGVGTRTVYFKVRNAGGESGVVSDTIFLVPETISVAAGTFTMGRTSAGDDATYGSSDELPTHSVTLAAYQIGMGEVTNRQYCDVLNWALAQSYLKTSTGAAWAGTGDIYAGGNLQFILRLSSTDCQIQYSGGVFSSKTRVGLPGSTNYSMDTHPVVHVSWYGSVAFCNWLSQMQGLTPCYEMSTANWPLTLVPPTSGGYRLPTEAEWERAAAWDGSKHWIYGFTSDMLTGKDRVNYWDNNPNDVNPLGLTTYPHTSPDAWFDGVHASPNGNVTTVNSVSPVGAYDMSGNVWEWCHDWYLDTYYTGGAMTNPTGPATGTYRAIRGGMWDYYPGSYCRSAARGYFTPSFSDYTFGFRLARPELSVEVTSFAINSGAATSTNPVVTLDNTCTGDPVDYMASELATFSGASWQPYSTAPSFTLSFGVGTRTVYFKVKNGAGESAVVSDTIFMVPNMLSVSEGTFTMGDGEWGDNDELPLHDVTLGAYQIGRGEVTNKEYCDVLNWAKAQGYLKTPFGAAWAGAGEIYAGDNRQVIVGISLTDCNIRYSGGVFISKTRVGLPGSTNYSMDTHPMVVASWYGAVAFCNWLSQMQGLTPCYDMATANWPLTTPPPTSGGYRLPTEAEWERAAAWDGTKHWIYGFTSDTNLSTNQCNDYWYDGIIWAYVNPLGLTTTPYTSPDAWFDGVHVSPNGSVTTVYSVSPVGAYDMSGNVREWCHDWYLSTYYTSGGSPWNNPTGPASGTRRVIRGGSWDIAFVACRTAARENVFPESGANALGFRLAKS